MPDERRHDGKISERRPEDIQAVRRERVSAVSLDQTHVDTLTHGATTREWNGPQIAVTNVLEAGVSPEMIADHYIPAIARQMGERWCTDEVGFAEVTIGTSRLQSMLRHLGPEWSGDVSARSDAPTILIVVAEDIYHTLGAMVLAGQLRRKGISTRLLLGATQADVSTQTAQLRFDAVFLSASCGETLESLRKIVDSIRQEPNSPTPVVIGGTILTEAPDAKTLTGADFATNDPDEALALCGLKETQSQSHLQRQGS